MAIVDLDGALAGMQYPREIVKLASAALVAGRPHSQWYTSGCPGAGVGSTAGLVGEVLTSPVIGQIPFTNPVTGNSYLARLAGQASQPGQLVLIDRLWQNGGVVNGIVPTIFGTEQLFTSSLPIPARDANGTTVGTGVMAAVEVSVVTGLGTPTLTLRYTNTANQSKTATNVIPTVASSIAGTFYPIGWAAGDTGIQKADAITLSATWTSGTIHVVLYRIIARLELTVANIPNAIDALTSGFPRIYDSSVLSTIFIPQTTTATSITGHCIVSQG